VAELEKKKTGGITALGVACVVLGAVWIVTAVWAALQPETIKAQTARFQAPQLLTGFSASAAYASAAINLLLAALLFAAGVGLLRLKKWGASLALWYAVGRIVWSILDTALAYLGPFKNRPAIPPGATRTAYAEYMSTRFVPVSTTILVAGFVLSLILPVVLLCLLSRKTYKDNLS